MATPTPCFRCQRYPEEDESPFQRCGRCMSRSYCSQQCQRNDWKNHKQECQFIADGGPVPQRTRTTMRLNKNAFFGEAARDFDPDILYYLKTSKPHIGDITISGPYYPIDNMIEQIRWRLSQENSPQGSRTFEELLEAPGIGGIEHLNAPLPDGEVMRLQIQRERNAEVAAALRGRAPGTPLSTYKVYETVPDPSTHDANYEHEEDFVPLREANIHATFTTKEAATRSATDLVKEWERRWPDCRGTTMMQDGLLAGGLVGPDREMRRMFQVMHDDGRKQYADGSVGY